MGIIKQLPELVANQISAGEVIERPASIVKELVENSIDAGSTEIIIEVENGGKDSIRVIDNGKGIADDDLELAFARYATSKIETVSDLYSIRTLGFRGEALASISSISKVEIYSRSKDSLKGSRMLLEGGEIIKKEPAGIPVGTDITIKDIFYNTPARYKYLKTINTEFGHISNIISREALAYPEIKFTLIHNKREVLKTPGTGELLDAIYTIYGEEIINQLIKMDYEESYIKINGFISRPDYTRSSRSHQLFFVNKRTVYNRSLSRGIEKGYHGFIAPGRYPLVFLNIKLNQVLVDVNVHPSKREVKFSREEIIEKIVEKGVKKTLSQVNTAVQLKINKRREAKFQETRFNFKEYLDRPNLYPGQIGSEERAREIHSTNIQANDKQESAEKAKDNLITLTEKRDNISGSRTRTDKRVIGEEKAPFRAGKIKRIFGQILNTYILAEGTDGLYIIDQHNAHERVIYERYFNKFNQEEIIRQALIVPVNIELTTGEAELINKHLSLLNKLGIKIETFGSNSFIVTELPVFLKNISGNVIVREIIDRIIENRQSHQAAELITDLISLMACKAAIKAGKYMDMREMEELLLDLFKTENPERCPHGRPIIVQISNADIARSMGR